MKLLSAKLKKVALGKMSEADVEDWPTPTSAMRESRLPEPGLGRVLAIALSTATTEILLMICMVDVEEAFGFYQLTECGVDGEEYKLMVDWKRFSKTVI